MSKNDKIVCQVISGDFMVKVSVIVPVYNAEKTLSRCLGNLVHQTLKDIELILVNDCSTDGSLQILLDCTIPVTYAGGIRDIEDIKKIEEYSSGAVDFTIGSALDIFGGNMSFEEVCRRVQK